MEQLQKAMQDIQVVVFAVGSGGKTGADKTMMVDLDGAVKAIEAAKTMSVSRFLLVSAIGSQNRELWSYGQRNLSTGNYYYSAKYYADVWLKKSNLDYTIIRPALLVNDAPQGQIDLAPNLELKFAGKVRTITRSDVAETILECLNQPNTIKHSFDLSNGSTPIAQALANLQ